MHGLSNARQSASACPFSSESRVHHCLSPFSLDWHPFHPSMDRFSRIQLPLNLAEGEVSERFKVLAWKASVGNTTGGSNPPLSASPNNQNNDAFPGEGGR